MFKNAFLKGAIANKQAFKGAAIEIGLENFFYAIYQANLQIKIIRKSQK